MIRASHRKINISVLFAALLFACVLGFTSVAGAATEIKAAGEVKGAVLDTEVGSVPSQSGQRAEPVAPFSTSTEAKPAKMMKYEDINYVAMVADREPGEMLVLNCTVSKATDETVLTRLAEKLYQDYNGRNYDDVTIYWHVGMNPEPAQPWARTDINKVDVQYEIVKIQ